MASKATKRSRAGRVLDDRQMAFLQHQPYHYNAYSVSYLDDYVQPFWRWLVTYVPAHWTASQITAIGLLTSFGSAGLTLYYTPTFTEVAPSWLYVLNAISLFLYQTYDALDGKQSYRTQCCELEEFSDHAADSLSTTFLAISLASAFQIGHSDLLIPLFGCSMIALYTTHSVAYFTHSCIFEKFDVTEVQWFAIILQLATAWKGQQLWSEGLNIGSLHLALGSFLVCQSGFGFVRKTLQNILLLLGRPTPLDDIGLRIPRRRLHLQTFYLLILLVILMAANYMIYLSQPTTARQPALFMLIHGFAVGKAACMLVVQSMTRAKMPTFDSSLLWPALLLVLSFVHHSRSRFQTTPSPPSIQIMTTIVCLALADHAYYCIRVCQDICEARDINMFSLKYGKTHMMDEGNYIAGESPEAFPNARKKWKAFSEDPAKREAFKALYGVM